MTTPISDHAAQFLSAAPLGDMLLISDYGKGVCTSGMLQALGDRARAARTPILVDPAQGRRWSDYGQVTLIKANRIEAMDGTSGETRPLAMARRLADEYQCSVVVTYAGHGMVAAERGGGTWYLPSGDVEVRDVCGAGDTVLAAQSVAIARGAALQEACAFAVRAGAQQVSRVGIAPIIQRRALATEQP